MKKILFVRLDHIGDCFLTLPSISIYKRQFPDHSIHVLCKTNVSDIFKNSKEIDNVYTIDLFYTCNNYENKTSIFEMFKIIKRLNKEKYDLIYNFRPDFKDRLFLKFIYGFDTTDYKNSLYQNNCHVIKMNILNVMKTFQFKCDFKVNYSKFSIENKKYKNINQRFIFHIGGSYMKKFDNKKIIKLYKCLKEKYKDIILVKSKFDKIDLPEDCDFAEINNIIEWAYICSNSKNIICFDTGPAHIAAAYANKTFCIWGPTSINYFGLLGKNNYNLKVPGYKRDFIPGEVFDFEEYGTYLQDYSVEEIVKKTGEFF